jgi:UPF0271 protein
MLKVDLNCDMGESTSLWPYRVSDDISLLPYISSINLACGSHAGDADTAKELIQQAVLWDIAVGAHPSFPDKENFGRKELHFSEKDMYRIVYDQLAAISSIALMNGARIRHVKPHGALYNMVAVDHRLAFIVCSAIQAFDEDLMIYGLAGSEIVKVADLMGLKSCSEAFADRSYQDNGKLTPGTEQSTMIEDEEQCIQQALQMIQQGTVCTVNGKNIPVKAESICIHRDSKHPARLAKLIYDALQDHKIEISHP